MPNCQRHILYKEECYYFTMVWNMFVLGGTISSTIKYFNLILEKETTFYANRLKKYIFSRFFSSSFFLKGWTSLFSYINKNILPNNINSGNLKILSTSHHINIWTFGTLMCSNSIDQVGKKCFQRGGNLCRYKQMVNIMPLAMVNDLLGIARCCG